MERLPRAVRRVPHAAFRLAAMCLVALVAALVMPSPAAAHEGFETATPAPGERVDGTVDAVTILFGPTVSGANLALIGPDGTPVDTTLELVEDFGARLRFEPLTEPGVYTVRYLATAADDGHLLSGDYTFGFQTDAPDVEDDDSLTLWITVAWGALVLVAIGTIYWMRRARTRLAALTDESAHELAGPNTRDAGVTDARAADARVADAEDRSPEAAGDDAP